MAGPNLEFRPWPKKKGLNGQLNVDRDKLREQYLSGGHYSWIEFCKQHGYNPDVTARSNLPVHQWQAEFLAQQSQAIDEELITPALSMKREIGKRRLSYVDDWVKTADRLKKQFNYYMWLNEEAINEDLKYRKAVKDGKIPPDPTRVDQAMKPGLFKNFAGAGDVIRALEANALLITNGEAYKAAIPIRETDPDILKADAEGERLRNMEYGLLGNESVTNETLNAMLNQWVDQQALPAPEQPDTQDPLVPGSPLDPLDEG